MENTFWESWLPGILINVVAGLIVYLVADKVKEACSRFILFVTEFNKKISDTFYTDLARNKTRLLYLIPGVLIIVIFEALLINMVSFSFQAIHKLKYDMSNDLTEMSILGLNEESTQRFVLEYYDEIIIINNAIIVFLILYSWVLGVRLVRSVVIFKRNQHFNNQMIVLKPFVTSEQFDLFKKDWVMMKSKDDFNKLMERIYLIAELHGVKI